jgi:Cdc6-like AAA superfamily ATPase
MATLLPADFDVTSLPHGERRVCQSFLAGLDDTWFVVPHVPVTVDRDDTEIDLVLVSPAHGVVVVEVKGGAIAIEQGRWVQNGRRLDKSPVEQVMKAKHCLLQRMRTARVDMNQLFVRHVVALPDVGEVPPGGLTPDAPAEIVFAKPQLEFPAHALAHVHREQPPVPPDHVARFLAALRPDVELPAGGGQVLRWARTRLDDETRLHLANIAGLDTNRRVLVTGGAGTGKTVLVKEWAKRAIGRGERVLVVCFNKPIAEYLQRVLEGTSAMVGTYHDVAVRLLEPHGWRVGQQPTPEYWRDAVTEALAFHAGHIGTPFDTVVVDEGQDFFEHWTDSLTQLLDPTGPRRLLMCADPGQALYVKGWRPPPGMVEVPLVHNLRNCVAVGRVVQRLGGPVPLPTAPFGDRVAHLAAGGVREVRERVRAVVERLTQQYGLPFRDIAVLTTRTDVRDLLRLEPPDGVPLVEWESRCEDAVLCETVHRAKGLERTAVVLVDLTGAPDPVVLYVGVSRAVSSLTLVGPPALAHAAGIPST